MANLSQYEEGPEAKGMESGFALDSLLRQERAAQQRTAMQELGNLLRHQRSEEAAAARQQTINQTEIEKERMREASALAAMLKKQDLAKQDAEEARQREAGYSGEYLYDLTKDRRGKVALRNAGLGTTGPETPAVPPTYYAESNPEAAATLPPRTPGVPAQPGEWVPPTREELMNIARVNPMLAKQIVERMMEKPYRHTVGENQGVLEIDPVTGERTLLEGPKAATSSGLFPSYEAAKADAQKTTADLRRVHYSQTKDGWKWEEMTAGGVTANEDAWLEKSRDESLPPATRAKYKSMYEDRQADKLAQSTQRNINNQWYPISEKEEARIQENIKSASVQERLLSYQPRELDLFFGAPKKAADVLNYLAGQGQIGQELIKKFGGNPEQFLAEKAQFEQAMAEDARQIMSRVEGAGGQMTINEEKRLTPIFAGTSNNAIAMQAKARVTRALKMAENDLIRYKHTVDPNTYMELVTDPVTKEQRTRASLYYKQRLEVYADGLFNPDARVGGLNSQKTGGQRLREYSGGTK